MNSVMTFSRNAVDPDSISKDPDYSSNFKVEIFFKDICNLCKPTTSLESKCQYCKEKMANDMVFWQIIHDILNVIYFLTKSFI